MKSWLDKIKWDHLGLVPVIAQDVNNKKVLMLAWMNQLALEKTQKLKKAIYWSRSRQTLWMKGESSGHIQIVKSIKLDCDADTILLGVEQTGLACHTGRKHCFYNSLEDDMWKTTDSVIKDPKDIYKKND